MSQHISVSVIIPTYNRRSCIGRAIDSVLAQTRQANEIVIVDDGSTDGTARWIQEHYPGIKVHCQENHGVSHARNRAIDNSTGDWLALLDSDDYWYPNKLEVQLQALARQPDFRLCHCDEHWVRNGRRVNPMNKHKKRGGSIFEHCLPLCAISPSAALIHRSVFDDIGEFDESLPACEDYDFWLRLCATEPVLYIDEALLVKTGGHEDQLSRQHWGMDRFRLQALAKSLRSGQLTARQTEMTQAVFLEKLAIYSQGALKRNRGDEIAALHELYSDIVVNHARPNASS